MGYLLIIDTGLVVKMIESRNQKTNDAFSAEIGIGNNIHDKLDPEIRLTAIWGNQGIEPERSGISADREHPQVLPEFHEVAVTSLPVKGQNLDSVLHKALHEHVRKICFPRTAPAGYQDVLLQPAAFQGKRI